MRLHFGFTTCSTRHSREPTMLLLLRHPLKLLLLAALLGACAQAFAAPPSRHQQARDHDQPARDHASRDHADRTRRNDDALSDSVRRIERSTRGQVLSAERVPYDGRNVNRIKIVDDRGRVRVYMDDPQSRPEPPQPGLQPPPTRGDDD
jgi:hypothetical protein